MARGDGIVRQQRLWRMLDERRAIEVGEAASGLGCTRRTVYRDLEVLQRTGAPLYQEPEGRRRRWRLVDGPRRRLSVTLSWSEMLALTTGRDLLSGLAGTFFHEAAISALEKIRDALPPALAERADTVAGVLLAERRPGRDYRSRRELVRSLVEAIDRRETVVLRYRKLRARREEERAVDPYHLHVHAGALYVVGYCHRRRDLRTFLVDRAAGVRLTGRTFSRRGDLDVTSILQGDLGPWSGPAVAIRLRFSPAAARLAAERKVHPSQIAQLRADGSLDVRLRAPLAPALDRWLLGWGAEVAVLAPARLAARLRKLHEDAVGYSLRSGNRASETEIRRRVTAADKHLTELLTPKACNEHVGRSRSAKHR